MTAIVSPSPICCVVLIRSSVHRDSRSTDAELAGCLLLLSVTFRFLQNLPDVCQGGPGTMLPICKQLLLALDDLMDGEIFLGCPAELDDRDPINHAPPGLTDGHPP